VLAVESLVNDTAVNARVAGPVRGLLRKETLVKTSIMRIACFVALISLMGVMGLLAVSCGDDDEEAATPQASVPPTATAGAAATAQPSATSEADEYEGWLTYKNDKYQYEFRYPDGATVSQAGVEAFGLSEEEWKEGVTPEEKFEKYTGDICVGITYELGYAYISAPVNAGFAHAQCGRTGMGYEGVEKEEALVIDGKSYTAKGFEEKGPGETLNFHNETLVVTLDDGTRIEYGARPDEAATFADYLEFRLELLKIVQSYRPL